MNIKLVCLFILFIICIRSKEGFSNKLLESCFKTNMYNDFNKHSEMIKIPGGVVYATPTKHIPNIPMISWNGIFLNNLCIDPNLRNHGLGTKLVLSVIDKAVFFLS